MASHAPRPVGIWIATIWAGMFAGFFPVAIMLLFCFGPAAGYEMVGPIRLLLSISLGTGVIVAAIGTWMGNSRARSALAVLVVIHYALIAYQNYQLAVSGVEVRGSVALPWGRVVRSIITASIIAGYLLFSKAARKFFDGQPEPVAVPTQISN
jgi:hypothetical protein